MTVSYTHLDVYKRQQHPLVLLYAVGRSQSIPPNPERRDGILQFSCGFVRIKGDS